MTEKIHEMTSRTGLEAAQAYQAAKANRQAMYGLMKLIPSFADLYEEMEATYVKVCERMGVPHEPRFDEDEYKQSQRYRDILEGRA